MSMFGKRKFWRATPRDQDTATESYTANEPRYEVAEEDATYVGSYIETDILFGERIHWPAIDIDHPVWLRESSPGKFHLYIDKDVNESDYFNLLDALVNCGLVEEGFVKASIERGQTMLRLNMSDKHGEDARFVMNDSRQNINRYIALSEIAKKKEQEHVATNNYGYTLSE